ncbi:MAG: hypothetical protein LBF60_08915, partial [Treponema sp.]|nr:hypothetical protein [Treponema sp.]
MVRIARMKMSMERKIGWTAFEDKPCLRYTRRLVSIGAGSKEGSTDYADFHRLKKMLCTEICVNLRNL